MSAHGPRWRDAVSDLIRLKASNKQLYEALETLCDAAFLSGANPDTNGSRKALDAAIAEGRATLAKISGEQETGNSKPVCDACGTVSCGGHPEPEA